MNCQTCFDIQSDESKIAPIKWEFPCCQFDTPGHFPVILIFLPLLPPLNLNEFSFYHSLWYLLLLNFYWNFVSKVFCFMTLRRAIHAMRTWTINLRLKIWGFSNFGWNLGWWFFEGIISLGILIESLRKHRWNGRNTHKYEEE